MATPIIHCTLLPLPRLLGCVRVCKVHSGRRPRSAWRRHCFCAAPIAPPSCSRLIVAAQMHDAAQSTWDHNCPPRWPAPALRDLHPVCSPPILPSCSPGNTRSQTPPRRPNALSSNAAVRRIKSVARCPRPVSGSSGATPLSPGYSSTLCKLSGRLPEPASLCPAVLLSPAPARLYMSIGSLFFAVGTLFQSAPLCCEIWPLLHQTCCISSVAGSLQAFRAPSTRHPTM